jgi:hypothetical protein
MPASSRFVAVGVPSDANLLERCGQRAPPPHDIYQCTPPPVSVKAVEMPTPPSARRHPGRFIFAVVNHSTLKKHCVNGREDVWRPACKQWRWFLVVVREVEWNWKGRNHNGKSRDQKVRTHTLPMRCTERKRVLRRLVSLRRQRRRGNRVSMRPHRMSADGSAVCASICR